MSRAFKIYCTVCKSQAKITRTERPLQGFSRLYCSCNNPECLHRFVMNLEFSHTTRTSLLDKDAFINTLISQFSPEEKAKMLTALQKENSPTK
ncbi:ogr/Delta-like zinc finger family protein [Avibacterium paragallinarum]|uniref:ogr/Delta-like zinc finger family protein n=1 Tax=Avibacterium paragallinarum TaxID=728 RepID=UPI0005559470|nr:ogr/Delta-like zinc finger family protein [Avibacterium paragallinarum]AZI13291.1 transcriptional regulator [Avibacterium paragallinarum]QIR12754.1 ogr/Delta-like zinc finger family protein [Avibacterium paragallinarum]QJE10708.1 ogr/Delta-like zinc finger family protein [Avibacterium paragallinarum]QJE12902.1 ogr/Delta-like zinc finger family protein [Avibacterium paragallinarum]QJE15104.1 ogr/Delta-like zinc finger family protein [Avibacterium paragallinarum]